MRSGSQVPRMETRNRHSAEDTKRAVLNTLYPIGCCRVIHWREQTEDARRLNADVITADVRLLHLSHERIAARILAALEPPKTDPETPGVNIDGLRRLLDALDNGDH